MASPIAESRVADQAPVLPRPEPLGKIDSDVAVEDVMKQYEFNQLASVQPGEKSFVWPEGSRPNIAHDAYDFELPVIDLTPVLKLQSLRREIEHLKGEANNTADLEAEIQACEAARLDVAKSIRAACEEYGFFQIIHTGFPMEVVDQFRESYRQIFDLPLEEKMKAKKVRTPGKLLHGYMPMKRNHMVNEMHPSYSWNESMDAESPEILYPGRVEEIANIFWPGPESSEKHHLFRSITEEYGTESSKLTFLLLDLIVSSLGIPEEAVNSLLGDREKQQVTFKIRVNNYPMCQHPELTWGLDSHTDPDLLTILHQDSVGGLQIRFKDGTWHGVQPRPGAFIINCGDHLQAWTNGRLLSAEHRVVTNQKFRRMSVAAFVLNAPDYVFSPRPECVDADHPIRYRPFTPTEYLKAIMSYGIARERGQLLDKVFAIQT